ncbi:MAG: alpha/beta hydrolase-fold protein [Chloroflexi bacterium]|nr:alpha/beta hydrolase-fold protein [Chloroflexota bacterium]
MPSDGPRSWGKLLMSGILLLAGCRRLHKEPFEKLPLARNDVQAVQLDERANLIVERVRFWSAEMNEPRFFLALLPKTSKQVNEVFILNHGWKDRPELLLSELKVDRVYEGLLERNAIRPAVLIIPDVRFSSFYRQHSERFPFPNYLTLVAEEVAGQVSRRYKIPFDRQRWSIGGFSFGGYLSLDVSRRYAGRFGAVSVVSGLFDRQWSYWPSEPPAPGKLDSQGRGKQTLVQPGPVPRIFLACGTHDFLFATMRSLHDTLTDLGIRHEWFTASGGHTWKYWSSVLEPMFEFHLGNLYRSPTP